MKYLNTTGDKSAATFKANKPKNTPMQLMTLIFMAAAITKNQKREDIEKIKFEHRNTSTQFYVCVFDIPKKLMKKGTGRYDNQRGYEHFVEKAKEYILPAKDLDCSWLCSYEKYEDRAK